jgi:lysophospholipase L1-like esterase
MKHLFLFLLLLLSAQFSQAQQAPFQDEIDQFKQQDKQHFPPKNAILFVGSSSFRMWSDVQNYFPGYTIINRGFGGSTLPDVIHFAPDIIYPYHPKQVVIYCGDNDLASSDTVTAKTVFERFKTLFTMIRQHEPNASVVFVSIKPSPIREQLMPKMRQANTLIQQFLKTQQHTAYVDVFTPMLNDAGKPRKELFREDMLHMKPAGYAIWQKALQPYLIK